MSTNATLGYLSDAQWHEALVDVVARGGPPLDPETVAVLVEHRRQCEREAEKLGLTLAEDWFIFAGSPDGRVHSKPSSVSQRYKRCAERLGIDLDPFTAGLPLGPLASVHVYSSNA